MKFLIVAILGGVLLASNSAHASQKHTYDALDRITTNVSGTMVVRFSYDSCGNISKISKKPDPGLKPSPLDIIPSSYQGLAQSASGTLDNALVSLSLTGKGSFTGSLALRGIISKFSGLLSLDKEGVFGWNGTIHRPGLSDLILALRLDPSDPSGCISATLSDDTASALASLSRAAFSKSRPALLAGNYTVLLPANPDFPGNAYPQGDGFALLSLGTDGSIRLVGQLGDGSPFSQSGKLAEDGRFAVSIPLYGGKGLLSGWIDFQPVNAVSDFNGTLEWGKDGLPGDPLYPGGFDCMVDIMGSRYLPPGPTIPLLNLAPKADNAVVVIGEGNLSAPITLAITIDALSKASTAAQVPGAFTLSFTRKTGLFKGSFLHPVTGATAGFTGVVFQKQNLGSGVFKAATESGYINILQSGSSALLLPPK